jgi:putative peptidoglycan lipid II flippase
MTTVIGAGDDARGVTLTAPERATGGLAAITSRVAAATLLVQVLSFGSSIVLATWLGATSQTDAYYLALSIPTIAYTVMVAALRQGAIPMLTKIDRTAGSAAFGEASSEVLSGTLAASVGLAIAVSAAMMLLLPVLAGGTPRLAGLTRLYIAELTPYAVTGAALGVLGAVLAVRESFVAAVAVLMVEPVLKSLLVILFGHAIGAQALVIGNVVGNAIAVAILLLMLGRVGVTLQLKAFRSSPVLRSLLKLSVPLLVSQALLQLNPVVDRSFAAPLGPGNVTVFELGVRLFNVPAALLASTLIAPLAARWAALDVQVGWDAVLRSFAKVLSAIWVIVIPLVVIGIVMRHPLVAMLYRGGAYTAHDVGRTADVLGMLLLGLTAQILVVPLATLFIVKGDTVFPMKVGIANFVLNAGLDAALRGPFGVAGIALSTSVTVTVLAFVFVREAHRRWPAFGVRGTITPLVMSLCTGAVSAAIGLTAMDVAGSHTSRLGAAALVVSVAAISLTVHGAALLWVRGSVTPGARLADGLLARFSSAPRFTEREA